MKPGIYPNVPMADYLALPYFSSSLANILLTQSPAHAKYQLDHREQDDSDASDVGTAIHDGLLEGVDRIEIIEAKDWRTNAAKEQRDLARRAGKIPLLAAKAAVVQGAIDAAREFLEHSELALDLSTGTPEQTAIWKEGEVICKARPDWLGPGVMLHLKTTLGSAQPESWIRNYLVKDGYDVAYSFYARSFNDSRVQSVFLVVEQSPPHGCSLIALSPALREIADAKVERAIRTWADCAERNRWPCYPPNISYAEPTGWQMAQAEEQRYFDEDGVLQA